jgi:hypothetical protein
MHLTHEEISCYRNHSLAPAQILRVREHVDICGECRGKLASDAGDAAVVQALFSSEPDEQELVLFAAGRLPDARAREIEAHVASCTDCAEAIDDLRQFAPKAKVQPIRKPRPLWWGALAAALLLAAGGLAWFYAGRTAQQPLVASLHDGPGADPQGRAWAAEALRTGRLPLGAPLPAAAPGVLRGTPGETAFTLLAPLNRRVVSDRPEFHWEPLAGASSYEVTVFTTDEKIVAHGVTSTTQWQPEQSVPREVRLGWQVTAHRGSTRVTAPAPPAAPVFFEVIPSDAGVRIERARSAQSPSHLELAALYAHEGMVEEAQGELAALETANPGSAVISQLRRSLTGQ